MSIKRIGPMTRKSNFLSRAYGIRVGKTFKCEECGESFKIVQRFSNVDDLDFYKKAEIFSNWIDVKLRKPKNGLSKEEVCFFFYFDCPFCGKRHFTEVYSARQYESLEVAGFWSDLEKFERNIIDMSNRSSKHRRAKVEDDVKYLEKATTGSYVKDSNTGLYSRVEFYHGV